MNPPPYTPPAGTFVFRSFVAFDELDMQGILHHSRHLLHVERAAHALFLEAMGAEGFDPARYPDQNAVVHRLEIEYKRPVAGVVPILVLLRVTSLRACTMTTAFEIRTLDGALCSRGIRETCRVRTDGLHPAIWSEDYRAAFEPRVCAE
jgi:acyl-CoA thioesterase FadM